MAKFGWLAFLFASVFLYAKYVRRLNLSDAMGTGDWMMLVAVSPLFDATLYILAMTSGFVFSILAGFAISQYQKKETIPLAGLIGVWLIPILAFEGKCQYFIWSFLLS
ncbi:MAG: hypothetical protein WEC59_00285 [Salibacteraceae bacterium]